MLLKEIQSTAQKLRRRETAVVEHDPASLGATLRALAVRAHQHVRLMDETRLRPASDLNAGELFNLERELIELHAEIRPASTAATRTKPRRSREVRLCIAAARRGISDLTSRCPARPDSIS